MTTASPADVPTAAWIDDWIDVLPSGRVVVRTGKVELGTGVAIAMVQIAAEELDVPVASVDLDRVRTGTSPDEGYTAGSRSIRDGGTALRRVAAEARWVLLGTAGRLLGAEPALLRVRDGVVTAPDGRTCRYADLVGDSPLHTLVTGTAPLKSPDEYRIVGTAVQRTDIPLKVVGQGGFVTDVRLPGMVHARVVRPPELGAHLVDVDESGLPAGASIVREGDFLAVVAEREDVAIKAAEALVVTWTPGVPPPTASELHDWMRHQTTDEALLRSDPVPPGEGPVSRAEYHWPFQAHASIGPSCAVADIRAHEATIHAAAQGVYPLQAGLAALLGLDVDHVAVVHHEGSGCYGHNGADDVAADAAVVSQLVGRPVRVQWSRADELVWARKGPAMVVDLAADVNKSGEIRYWTSHVWTPTHGGRARTPDRFVAGFLREGKVEPDDVRYVGGDRNAVVDYTVAQHVEMHWLRRPALPSSSLRALGATAATFANESFIDELAAAAGVDPVAYRRRHLDDLRSLAVLDAVVEAAGWGDSLPAGRGRGIAFARYENTGAYLAAVAEVSVDVDSGVVQVEHVWISHDCGLIVNPDGLRNQVVGNVIQSLSRAMKEEVRWDGAGITTRDWETYPIIRFSELPPIDVILIDRPDEPAVGAGEPATVTTAPAIANAIAAATGARLRAAPFTPERVRAALDAREQHVS